MNVAAGFKTVTGSATAGGSDTAYLYDTAGNDVFVSTAAYSYLQGGGLTNVAAGFRTVLASATAGGTDVAYLYDTAGNDVFYGQQAGGVLYTSSGVRGVYRASQEPHSTRAEPPGASQKARSRVPMFFRGSIVPTASKYRGGSRCFRQIASTDSAGCGW